MKRRKHLEDDKNLAETSTNTDKTEKVSSEKKKFFKQLTLVVGFVFVLVGAGLYVKGFFNNETANKYYVGSEIIDLYEKYDRNKDGFLDLNEFEPLGHKILSFKQKLVVQNLPAKNEEEIITLNAFFTPLVSANILNSSYVPVSLKTNQNWDNYLNF